MWYSYAITEKLSSRRASCKLSTDSKHQCELLSEQRLLNTVTTTIQKPAKYERIQLAHRTASPLRMDKDIFCVLFDTELADRLNLLFSLCPSINPSIHRNVIVGAPHRHPMVQAHREAGRIIIVAHMRRGDVLESRVRWRTAAD